MKPMESAVRSPGAADERHPLQDDEAADDRRHQADDDGRDERPLHELERPGLAQEVRDLAHGPTIVLSPPGSTSRWRSNAWDRCSSVNTSAERPKATTLRLSNTAWSKLAATQERSCVATNNVLSSRRSSSSRPSRSCCAVASS